MTVVAHEIGHVLGLGHYRQLNDDPNQMSVDSACLNGETERGNATDTLHALGNNTNRETMCVPIYPGTERQRTPEEHEKEALRRLYPPTGPAPAISQAGPQAGTGTYTWTVTVPKDPNRATSFYFIYGDGTYETRSIPQGSGTASYSFSHAFGATGTYTQRTTIVETGAFADAFMVAEARISRDPRDAIDLGGEDLWCGWRRAAAPAGSHFSSRRRVLSVYTSWGAWCLGPEAANSPTTSSAARPDRRPLAQGLLVCSRALPRGVRRHAAEQGACPRPCAPPPRRAFRIR